MVVEKLTLEERIYFEPLDIVFEASYPWNGSEFYGKLVERVKLYHSNPVRWGANIMDRNSLWPIPQTVIDLNIGAVLSQNPGY